VLKSCYFGLIRRLRSRKDGGPIDAPSPQVAAQLGKHVTAREPQKRAHAADVWIDSAASHGRPSWPSVTRFGTPGGVPWRWGHSSFRQGTATQAGQPTALSKGIAVQGRTPAGSVQPVRPSTPACAPPPAGTARPLIPGQPPAASPHAAPRCDRQSRVFVKPWRRSHDRPGRGRTVQTGRSHVPDPSRGIRRGHWDRPY
jgi:hypothetical protein